MRAIGASTHGAARTCTLHMRTHASAECLNLKTHSMTVAHACRQARMCSGNTACGTCTHITIASLHACACARTCAHTPLLRACACITHSITHIRVSKQAPRVSARRVRITGTRAKLKHSCMNLYTHMRTHACADILTHCKHTCAQAGKPLCISAKRARIHFDKCARN